MYSSTRPRNWKLLIFGAVVGLVYGLLIRVGAQMQIRGWTSVMSMAFLVLVPVAMGFVTVFVVELREPQPVWIWLLLPWVTVIGGALATIVALWEGFICVIMLLPIALVCASFGGVLAGLVITSSTLADGEKRLSVYRRTVAAVEFLVDAASLHPARPAESRKRRRDPCTSVYCVGQYPASAENRARRASSVLESRDRLSPPNRSHTFL